MLFLCFSDYETLVKDCEDEDSGEFTFTREYISAVLSKYFKDYTLDLTQIYDYNAERDAVVTVQASGFGGCRNPELVEKEWNGSIVTFTVDYYEKNLSDRILRRRGLLSVSDPEVKNQ